MSLRGTFVGIAVPVMLAATVVGCSSQPAQSLNAATRPAPAPNTTHAGRWNHVVVVVEENHAYGEVVGNASAPYINRLAHVGASFTRSYALTHPSQPNYVALFSGSAHGVVSDSCPTTLHADNLGHQLRAAGYHFAGYSEGLPSVGDRVCSHGWYARKHSPWTDFTDLPGSVNRPLRTMPADFRRLPTVSFVIPDLQHDMHDGTVAQADGWLRSHLGRYARWARRHRSLLIVTWDEDDQSAGNHIATIAFGAGVRAGPVRQRVTHYNVLRTIEDAYRLRPLGAAAHVRGITRLGG